MNIKIKCTAHPGMFHDEYGVSVRTAEDTEWVGYMDKTFITLPDGVVVTEEGIEAQVEAFLVEKRAATVVVEMSTDGLVQGRRLIVPIDSWRANG